ncbi:MAG: permease [Armatimonadota bacterium]
MSDCCPTTKIKPEQKQNSEPSLQKRLLLTVLAVVVWVLAYRATLPFSEWLAFKLLGLGEKSHLGLSLQFFFYDVPKVMLLLSLVVWAIGIVRTFFTPERSRRLLAGRQFVGNIMAAALGIVTPFCSCSAVPLFIGFVQSGVPLGVTFSFLISAPMVNEVALVLLAGLFGWKVAAIYIAAGLTVAIVAGWVIGKMNLENEIEPWVREIAVGEGVDENPDWNSRLDAGITALKEIVGKVWPYVIAGIAVGAGIHGYAPTDMLSGIMGAGHWYSVPLAVIVGVPLYSNAAGIIPIVEALLAKGAALGSCLAFMMSTIGLSLPEAVILRKVLRPKLIAVFFGTVAVGIMLVGFMFNSLNLGAIHVR